MGHISNNFKPHKMTTDDVVMTESFLRTSREILDGMGIEGFSLDQVRGALLMLEQYQQIREEVADLRRVNVDKS